MEEKLRQNLPQRVGDYNHKRRQTLVPSTAVCLRFLWRLHLKLNRYWRFIESEG
jgi:hypothetical protein